MVKHLNALFKQVLSKALTKQCLQHGVRFIPAFFHNPVSCQARACGQNLVSLCFKMWQIALHCQMITACVCDDASHCH